MENNTNYDVCAFMTIAEVRKFLNISQSAAYQISKRKDFPVCRFGGNIRIPRDAFLAWVDSRTYVPTALIGGIKNGQEKE